MNKYKIIFNSSVLQKLEDIFVHLAHESPSLADNIINGIEKQITSLTSFPKRFPIIPEPVSYKNYEVRHLFYKKSFRIIYAIHNNEIRILDIRHSAQDCFIMDKS